MAIVISGVNNNDKITAADGTIDLLSGVSYAGIITAPAFTTPGNLTAGHLNIGSNIQLGNAGIATATTFVGNLTGNVNATSNLLLQIGGSEKFRVGSSGQLGIGGANYGTSGQVLTSGGSGSAATWSTINSDAINEGNTKAEVIDSGSDGRFIVETEGTQRIRIDSNGLGISSTTTAARNAGVGTAIGTIIFNSTDNKLQLYANDLNWRGFSPSDPSISSISGTMYASSASTLTLSGGNFLQTNLRVRFVQATRSVDVTVTVTPTSDSVASVDVPATVYNNIQANDVVSISVTNSDNVVSNTVTLTASSLPTGGTITTSGSYRIHTFTSSGNFVNTISSLSVQYLVIAGGGGGGVANGGGGGGGAGGYRINTGEMSGRRSSSEAAMTINTGTFPVVVGAGGAGNVHGGSSGSRGDAGTNSSFNSIVSNGGGYGGGDASRPGGGGGSGGAASRNNQSRGAGTAGQGGDGGRAASSGSQNSGGGGGGAGELLGPDGVENHTGGRGANGLSSSITGSSVGRAGGGGGGSETPVNSSGGSASSGGGLGGCAGSIGRAPTAGTANTGGGGGGSGDYNSGGNHNGKAGGSGIVIIRYQV